MLPAQQVGVMHNDTRVLMVCQALYTASLAIALTLTGIVGYSLASNKAYATLPFALITVAAAVTTIFAALAMKKFGRRIGFMTGGALATMGGLLSIVALYHHSFTTFCLGTACVGVFQAYAQYYRLAAADAVASASKGKAIAQVLGGGVIAAIAGPALAAWSQDWIPALLFSGAYVLVAVFGLLTCGLVYSFYDGSERCVLAVSVLPAQSARPLHVIFVQPMFIAALANNAIGYAVMMFVMTATPIAAIACGHTIVDGAYIMQWHMVGMYAPSLFSSRLMRYLGEIKIVLFGIFLSALSALIALQSSSLPNFYAALACLGIGWNFMFVGGSTLLAKSYLPAERHQVQACSEFLTFGFSALGSLGAGLLLAYFDWRVINLLTLPLLALAAVITVWHVLVGRAVNDQPYRHKDRDRHS